MSRIVYIDYLRNFANITRCFIHAAVPYMVTAAPMWPVDDQGSWFFDFAIFEGHLYVMELFFMISGFMFAMELKRSSVRKTINNRFNRIVNNVFEQLGRDSALISFTYILRNFYLTLSKLCNRD